MGLYRRGQVWWMHFTYQGKRHRQSTETEDRKLAQRIYDKVKGQLAEGRWFEGSLGALKPDSLTDEPPFKDYAEKWLTTKVQIKEATMTSYRGILKNHLSPYFGQMRISDIKRSDIQGFVKAKVDEGALSPKTLGNVLVTLHQILAEAEIDGSISRSPYLKIARPRGEKEERDYLRAHEIQIFLDHCEPKIHALLYTAIFTGMRRGELLGLKWGDIDWVNAKINVRRAFYKGRLQSPKSEYSKRSIDMGPRLATVLKDHKTKQNLIRLKAGKNWIDNDLVFCNEEGGFLDADNLYHRDFRRILKKAGLRHLRIHDLRHTFASILIAAGHNAKYIQKQMGHSSFQISMDLYGHLMEEVHEGAAKRSEDFVFCHNFDTVKEKGATAISVTP